MSRVGRTGSDPLGRFAQNPDAGETSAALGVEILEAQWQSIGQAVRAFNLQAAESEFIPTEACRLSGHRSPPAGRIGGR